MAKNNESINLSEEQMDILKELGDESILELAKDEEEIDEVIGDEEDEDDDEEEDDDDGVGSDEDEDQDEEVEDEEEAKDQEKDTDQDSKGAIAERRKAKKRMATIEQQYQDKISKLEETIATLKPSEKIARALETVTGKQREELIDHIKASQQSIYENDGLTAEKAKFFADRMFESFDKDEQIVTEHTSKVKLLDLKLEAEELSRKHLYKGLKDHIDEVSDFAESKDISIEKAYLALHHDEFMERYNKSKAYEDKSQRAKKGNRKVEVVNGNKTVAKKKSNLSQEMIDVYSAAGLDLEEMELAASGMNVVDYQKEFAKLEKRRKG